MKVRNGILQEICEEFQVSICNPPFFDRSQGEKDAFGGVDEELCTSGGELKFIKDYIIESWSKRSGRTFTSLIGVKSHLTTLITFLETNFPRVSLQQTTFFQGRTIRWGLAWTFNN
jgi:23S rRNA A1618 N6-methylase RlmF